MSAARVLTRLVLAALAQITLFGVVVFFGEPQRVGRPPSAFHLVDIAYLALPLALGLAAVWAPLRALLRNRRSTTSPPAGFGRTVATERNSGYLQCGAGPRVRR